MTSKYLNFKLFFNKEEEMETSEDEKEEESPKPPFLRETLSGRNPKPPKR